MALLAPVLLEDEVDGPGAPNAILLGQLRSRHPSGMLLGDRRLRGTRDLSVGVHPPTKRWHRPIARRGVGGSSSPDPSHHGPGSQMNKTRPSVGAQCIPLPFRRCSTSLQALSVIPYRWDSPAPGWSRWTNCPSLIEPTIPREAGCEEPEWREPVLPH